MRVSIARRVLFLLPLWCAQREREYWLMEWKFSRGRGVGGVYPCRRSLARGINQMERRFICMSVCSPPLPRSNFCTTRICFIYPRLVIHLYRWLGCVCVRACVRVCVCVYAAQRDSKSQKRAARIRVYRNDARASSLKFKSRARARQSKLFRWSRYRVAEVYKHP